VPRIRICIVGCGAVGSLFAAHLARADEAEIWAYDVWKDHTDAIRKNGLRLSGAADFTANLNATSDPKALPRCHYGIVRHQSNPYGYCHRASGSCLC